MVNGQVLSPSEERHALQAVKGWFGVRDASMMLQVNLSAIGTTVTRLWLGSRRRHQTSLIFV
ncbi:hypothetical protein B0F90DRAFT_15608 [Multifurca ochricompacta]|uniref:Uncharacterized protein n=1 Tax=Multifurca ochricompacta TaxID=376703 RepID=A0AAD4MBV0_9AGAM|nr:hypothetical protein B0F90DRAFT_15608 [Multifurca ochricompacta]